MMKEDGVRNRKETRSRLDLPAIMSKVLWERAGRVSDRIRERTVAVSCSSVSDPFNPCITIQISHTGWYEE